MNPKDPAQPGVPYRSKTLAAWLALLLGTLGAHRFYLHGWRDRLGWLYVLPSLVGAVGVVRMRELGQDDRLAWLLVPLLGLMISVAMITGIVHALTPDETWDRRHNPGQAGRATGWGPVLAAIAGLMVGGAVLMGTIAFSGQKFFEWQLEDTGAARP
ncbi:MAG: NINE protein [Rubrivivax sp.]|nr:NINE protein [Rubrivivax sp.]